MGINNSCIHSQAVEDATGREDLIEALRNALLVHTAARLGYNKVARGDNATRIAARVIAMSSKGAGFALPSCIQYFDARQGPSVLNLQYSQCSHRLLLLRFPYLSSGSRCLHAWRMDSMAGEAPASCSVIRQVTCPTCCQRQSSPTHKPTKS